MAPFWGQIWGTMMPCPEHPCRGARRAYPISPMWGMGMLLHVSQGWPRSGPDTAPEWVRYRVLMSFICVTKYTIYYYEHNPEVINAYPLWEGVMGSCWLPMGAASEAIPCPYGGSLHGRRRDTPPRGGLSSLLVMTPEAEHIWPHK